MCYRHALYVGRAVQSALRQQGGPIDILISDDASDDGTFAVIEKAVGGYAGPHRVRLNRNDSNMGMRHFNRILELAEGDYIVVAHGDDYSNTERTSTLADIFEREKVSFVSSNCRVVTRDEQSLGRMAEDASHRMTPEDLIVGGWRPTLLGSTHAFHRDVLAKFGGVDTRFMPVSYDLAFPFRGALLEGAFYCDQELVAWRRHGRNMTDRLLRAAAGSDAQAEGILATLLTEQFAMLHDIMTLAAADRGRRRILRVQHRRLLESILLVSSEWVRARNRLLGEGVLPAWVAPESLNADSADYSGSELTPLVDGFLRMNRRLATLRAGRQAKKKAGP